MSDKDDCISRQAAIDAMKDMYRAAEKWLRDATDDVTKARAESCMASLVEIKLRIEKIPAAQPDHTADIGKKAEKEDIQTEPRWVPCSERLPEDGRCLVTRFDFVTNTCFLDILWYEKGVWWNRLCIGDFAVIAWMPLPEPYQEGGE